MAIGSFGKKSFSVNGNQIYTFSELQYSSSYETEDQDVEGKKPSTYKKGPGLNTMDLSLKLDASFKVNPREEMEDWEDIKDAGNPYIFVLGGRPFGNNKWLLTNVQASDMNIDNDGNILSVNISLKFTEYVRSGPSKESAKASKKKTTGVKQLVSVDPKLLMPSESEKAATKRTNPGMK